jgi:trehalose 6-phosphate phosphatase
MRRACAIARACSRAGGPRGERPMPRSAFPKPRAASRSTPRAAAPAGVPDYAHDWAFFLDIDGTLLDIAETPEAVQTDAADHRLLERLHAAAGGAVALVSGRTLAMIDELFAPLKLPAAGQHGYERRDGEGRRRRHRFDAGQLRPLARALREFAHAHPGVVFEDKGASVALHYRLAPQFRELAHERALAAAAMLPGEVEVQPGKMVWEVKPVGAHKGMAIEEFMREAPFRDRLPIFLGDDLTDEDGFRVVNRIGGHSIKVGAGDTAARWRLSDPAAARAWLAGWVDHYGR